MAHQHKKQKVETPQTELIFKLNSTIIIRQMLELSEQTPEDSTVLVDEILHSIFFLGKISFPNFSPHQIENDMKSDQLRHRFPKAFEHYSSELPRRSPISCLLDMIVQVEGQQNESRIIRKLREIMDQLERSKTPQLISFTICVSQKDVSPDSIRHYGVSMSTNGRLAGQIMVAASCLGGWDSHVADAVISRLKQTNFDGTFRIPEEVKCQAFSLKTGEEMHPCRSCRDLFGLDSDVNKSWAYGNCAEVESLSNLFKKEEQVKREIRPTSKTWTDANRQKAKEEVRSELKKLLKEKKISWNYNFYTPQRVLPHRSFGESFFI